MKITRTLFRSCLPIVVLLVVSMTAAALAQDEGGRGRGRGRGGFGRMGRMAGKSMLLRSDQVRGELKITDEQGKAIDEILASFREEMRSLRGGRGRGGFDLSDEERKKRRQEWREKFGKLRKTIEGKISAQLDEAQNTRLDQISLQHQGVDGFSAERVATALALSVEQKAKIREAVTAMHKEIRSLRRGGRGQGGGGGDGDKRREAREKSKKLRKSTKATVMAVLTEEQAKKFEELKGEPFDLDWSSLRGGRGDRDGRGRGEGRRGDKKDRKRPETDEAI